MTARTSTDPEQQALASRIRAARRARGWTQHDLAARTAIPRHTIAAIELSARRVDVLELTQLAQVLGTPIVELLGISPPDDTRLWQLIAGLDDTQITQLALYAEYLRWCADHPRPAPPALPRNPHTDAVPDHL